MRDARACSACVLRVRDVLACRGCVMCMRAARACVLRVGAARACCAFVLLPRAARVCCAQVVRVLCAPSLCACLVRVSCARTLRACALYVCFSLRLKSGMSVIPGLHSVLAGKSLRPRLALAKPGRFFFPASHRTTAQNLPFQSRGRFFVRVTGHADKKTSPMTLIFF